MNIFRGVKKVDDTAVERTVDIASVKALLEHVHKQLKPFKDALEVVALLEGVNQNEKELRSSIESAKKELDSTTAAIDTAKEELGMVRQEVLDIRALAAEEAAKIVADAHAEAAAHKAEVLVALEAEASSLKDEISGMALKKGDLFAANEKLMAANDALTSHIESIKKSLGV